MTDSELLSLAGAVIASNRRAVCLMRFLRIESIDFGAGYGIVALLMVGLLGLSLIRYEIY